jgi:ABC-type lipoprotein release transport system permease subunit
MNNAIERHKNILELSLSSLLRRKTKNLSLLVIYTLIVFAIASLLFFLSALKREAAFVLKDAPDMVVQRMVAGRQDLVPTSYGEKIGSLRGVRDARPRLWGYYYDAATGANYTVTTASGPSTASGTITIGSGISRTRQVFEGDLIALQSYTRVPLLLEIKQVLPYESELAAADLIVMSEQDFRHLFNFPAGYATDLALTIGNPRELTTVAMKIAEQFPDARPILKSEILRTYDSIFDWRGGMMLVMLIAALLSFIIFAWDKATGLSAEERKEIGILKSIGWETSDVLLLKFWEGVAISLSSFLVGVLLAYGHVYFLSAPLFEPVLKGWSVLYPQFTLVPAVDAYQLGVLFFLTVAPYTIATIIPCWRAATVDPEAAMRS